MSQPDIDLLIVECLDRYDVEGESALDDLCDRHPSVSAELRSAVMRLVGHGVASSPTPAPSLRFGPGARIGDYEIIDAVGRGGMGIVYEAKDVQLGRRVALKLMRTPVDFDDELAARFRREAAIAASLDHPGLVRVYAAGIHEAQPWLALEFVEGKGLDRLLADERAAQARNDESAADRRTEDSRLRSARPAELRRHVEILLEIADALAHMHERGLVHRDVKPSNVLLREDGSTALGDFGLARREDDLGLTQSGAFAGTPHYASPEQASGDSDALGPQSDVFSLGVLSYELLTLAKPFDGATQRRILDAIERHEPVDPSKLRPTLPEDLVAITLKALEKDPSQRYADAGEFAEELRAFLELRPVSARRASALTRSRRWLRREPLKAALLGVVATSGLVVAGLIGYGISQRPLIAQAQEQQRLDDAKNKSLQAWIRLTLDDDFKGARKLFEASLEQHERLEAVFGLSMCIALDEGQEARRVFLEDWMRRVPKSRALRRIYLRAKAYGSAQRGPRRGPS